MSEFEFIDAVRHNTNLLIAYAGATGTGKTWSALETALGLAGPNGTVALLDTEAGRATHYADIFKFKHGDLHPPFTPQRFLAAIHAAQEARYDVLIIDSASDEYEGEGGLQEMHDNAVVRLAKKQSIDDLEGWEYDKYNAPAWSGPKTTHKRVLMNPLRQLRMHVIFCLRAEDKIEFVKEEYVKDGQKREKTKVRQKGWTPICEKNFMYAMTISCVFSPDAPGVPMMTDKGLALNGKIQAQHLPAFPKGQQISRETGRLLGEWAKGAPLRKQPVGDLSERVTKAVDYISTRKTADGVNAAFAKCDGLLVELQKAEDVESALRITAARDERLRAIQEGR